MWAFAVVNGGDGDLGGSKIANVSVRRGECCS